MSDYYYLTDDKEAIPCEMDKWGRQRDEMRKTNTKHVAFEIIDGKEISTVWLGLNHQFNKRDKKPLIFETLVFDEKENEIYGERYSTWQEAEEGHKRAVNWVSCGCSEEDRK